MSENIDTVSDGPASSNHRFARIDVKLALVERQHFHAFLVVWIIGYASMVSMNQKLSIITLPIGANKR